MTQVLECRRSVGFPPATPAPPQLTRILDGIPFKEIWAVDFEFGAVSGENPRTDLPCCLGTSFRTHRAAIAGRVRLNPAL
jgi:hypothetical protein